MASLPDINTRFPYPVVDSGADPYVISFGDNFYYCFVRNDSETLFITKTSRLSDIGSIATKAVWKGPEGSPYGHSLWAPEIHKWGEKWYLYFAAGEYTETYDNQRMYVLEGEGADPQSADYKYLNSVHDSSDQWAIDGTILKMPDESRYFVWSGRENVDDLTQNIYIAKMDNPSTLVGERVLISSPTYEWEKKDGKINEGPQEVAQGNRRHIIYSASHSSGNHYCLGQLTLAGNDPLDADQWVKRSKPIYRPNQGLVATGHASFLLSEDQTWGWMAFHAVRYRGAGWDRQVRLNAFTISQDGDFYFLPTANRIQTIERMLTHSKTYRNVLQKLLW